MAAAGAKNAGTESGVEIDSSVDNSGACEATRGKSAATWRVQSNARQIRLKGGAIPCDLEGKERAFKIAAG